MLLKACMVHRQAVYEEEAGGTQHGEQQSSRPPQPPETEALEHVVRIAGLLAECGGAHLQENLSRQQGAAGGSGLAGRLGPAVSAGAFA